MVDLFATRLNHRLPLYVSPVLEPAAWAVDALSLDWNLMFGYAFPPFILIPTILRKIQLSQQCRILLIAPVWPQRSWFNDLLSYLADSPIRLPLQKDLLSQSRGRLFHANPEMLHLHAWPLSSDRLERNNFLQKLPLVSPNLEDPLLGSFTTQSGISSPIGVSQGRLIQSIPL